MSGTKLLAGVTPGYPLLACNSPSLIVLLIRASWVRPPPGSPKIKAKSPESLTRYRGFFRVMLAQAPTIRLIPTFKPALVDPDRGVHATMLDTAKGGIHYDRNR